MRRDIQQLTNIIKQTGFTPKTFAEIGSRDGHDTSFIQQWWGLDSKNCYVFEAHPQCYSHIIEQYPNFNTFNIAISNETKPVSFHAGKVGEEPNVGISSVLDRDNPTWIGEEIEVDGWRMDNIIEHLNIPVFDFMKVDVEGLGLEVLQGFGKYLNDVKFIQIELETQEVWKGQALYDEVVEWLGENSFEVHHNVVLDHLQNDTLFINKKK